MPSYGVACSATKHYVFHVKMFIEGLRYIWYCAGQVLRLQGQNIEEGTISDFRELTVQ